MQVMSCHYRITEESHTSPQPAGSIVLPLFHDPVSVHYIMGDSSSSDMLEDMRSKPLDLTRVPTVT